MPLQATSGAASYDAFGGGVPVVPKYIEDYFSTYLVTGDGTAPAVNNGIDLSTKGGLVWTKKRSAAGSHSLFDTARGANLRLISNDTAAQDSVNLSFTTTGFSNYTFDSGVTYTSWSWAKAPKFFDVVTYTGNGATGNAISHNLGSTPGCIIFKRTDSTGDWAVYHRGISGADDNFIYLNSTAATIGGPPYIVSSVGATSFTLGSNGAGGGNTITNASGATYVAYLFAHNAGGFGLTGTDNVISCGSYTGSDSTTTTVTLGYEPQWIMIKRATGDTSAYTGWAIFDNMRGMPVSGNDNTLLANTSDAENPVTANGAFVSPTATGFTLNVAGSNLTNTTNTYIYIAIRRGPMKVPTSGTSVFAPVLNTGTGANTNISSGSFAPDMLWNKNRDHSYGAEVWDKLRGVRAVGLTTSNTGAEGLSPVGYDLVSFNNTGVTEGANSGSVMNISTWLYVNYMFGRAPSFFDEVCYTGTGSARTITHNLAAVPELMIVKCRSTARAWPVYAAPLGNTEEPRLNESSASGSSTSWNSTTPTSSVFSVSNGSIVNASGDTYVAYLFATCAGVQYINSYVGDGTTGRTINCGFTGGARFVCIKATSTTGSWWTFDSARGIVTNNDPALQLNSTAAEVTSADAIDTASSGFIVNQEATCSLNASGVTYLVWAIA